MVQMRENGGKERERENGGKRKRRNERELKKSEEKVALLFWHIVAHMRNYTWKRGRVVYL